MWRQLTESLDESHVSELRKRILGKCEQIDDLRGGWDGAMKCGITAAQLMTKPIVTMPPETTVRELRELMKKVRTRHVLICKSVDCVDYLVGVVSDRDVLERRGKTAGKIMTPDPFTVSPSSSLGSALSLMIGKSISCVPVVERGDVRGVLTTTDLLLALECILEICEERYGLEALLA